MTPDRPLREQHHCDDRCVCLCHDPPLPLLYSRHFGTHACQDPECEFAHGFPDPKVIPPGWCPRDTDGDGNCGQPACRFCGSPR